jgi:hypothetical protein
MKKMIDLHKLLFLNRKEIQSREIGLSIDDMFDQEIFAAY